MAALTDWVRNIVMVILFASFLDLLLPSSSMQRFIRVIMGLTIMLAILTPALDFLQNRLMPGDMPTFLGSAVPANELATNEAMAKQREKVTLELYKKEFARQVRAVVLAIDGIADVRVAVNLTTASPNVKSVKVDKLTLYIQPGRSAEDRTVPKIAIGGPPGNGPELDAALTAKVRRTVSELYQLPDQQIEIRKMN